MVEREAQIIIYHDNMNKGGRAQWGPKEGKMDFNDGTITGKKEAKE